MNRRHFIKAGLAAGALAGIPGAKAMQNGISPSTSASGNQPPKVIFLVSDGMSHGVLALADTIKRMKDGKETAWTRLMKEFPDKVRHSGLMEMASATGPVTDSAAASSSWGSGHRVTNGSINIGPEGEVLEPILVSASRAGIAGGLVTTARVTHATPAGFLANNPNRNDEDGIAAQYLDRPIAVMMGGGKRHFSADKRKDGTAVDAAFAEKGIQVVTSRAEMDHADRGKAILGVFSDAHMPYEVDRIHSEKLKDTVPSLAAMTQKALAHLEDAPKGFLLQVEAARVDHGAHSNDTPASVFDQLAFDDACEVALAFQEKHPETVIIITTDHGNANPGLNGHGSGYKDSAECARKILGMKGSFEEILGNFPKDGTPAELKESVLAMTGITLGTDEATVVTDAIKKGNGPDPYQYRNRPLHTLSAVMANHIAVGWCGSTHTADYVPLTIIAPSAVSLPPLVKNTDLHQFVRQHLGI